MSILKKGQYDIKLVEQALIMPSDDKVFLSHAENYLNSHILTYFLEWGYDVVLGVDDSLSYSEYSHLKKICEQYKVTPDIRYVQYTVEASIRKALEGCDRIIHPLSEDKWYYPSEPVEIYKGAIAEALKLLYCASEEKVRRVLFTGSLVSVYGGSESSKIEVSDTDWGNPYKMTPQARAYLYTEKAVWAFLQTLTYPPKITVLNLGCMFGPSFSTIERHSSMKFMLKLFNGNIQNILPARTPTIDVRDAALLHVLALDNAETYDKRFNVCQGTYWLAEVAENLNHQYKIF